ncbi:hypothetical protein ASPSYDRAFT_636351 [Aspergillus sydowii CBS 593.65]|uniref:Uncharacterized protein n=1 Tax=Aspergillus sydowii CBS 593.65 TaxID=1036612 RepID=A0A1L9TSN8_9EURO|nr:uncharacterized protein ASPSYDRAFT_636351 [Aspergillus sydowii CBS 593.65]OJJ62293.1 hypothetical protein ASPSYDRAFT_636351 [Aspergillus sydowii CBS 593.65]
MHSQSKNQHCSRTRTGQLASHHIFHVVSIGIPTPYIILLVSGLKRYLGRARLGVIHQTDSICRSHVADSVIRFGLGGGRWLWRASKRCSCWLRHAA